MLEILVPVICELLIVIAGIITIVIVIQVLA